MQQKKVVKTPTKRQLRIAKLKASVTQIEAEIKTIQDQVDKLESQRDNLWTKVEVREDKIDKLESTILDLENEEAAAKRWPGEEKKIENWLIKTFGFKKPADKFVTLAAREIAFAIRSGGWK